MQTIHRSVNHWTAEEFVAGLTWTLVHQGLRETLFERLQQQQASASAMLTVQYRMNSHIMRWSSDEFYGGRLTAHNSVAEHTLHTLPVG
jgi:superfamily I DNA and/or RNA helicase